MPWSFFDPPFYIADPDHTFKKNVFLTNFFLLLVILIFGKQFLDPPFWDADPLLIRLTISKKYLWLFKKKKNHHHLFIVTGSWSHFLRMWQIFRYEDLKIMRIRIRDTACQKLSPFKSPAEFVVKYFNGFMEFWLIIWAELLSLSLRAT